MDMDALLNDEAFKAQIENAKNTSEVVELLKSNGIDVTEEMLKAAFAPEGELGEDALEGVAGGGKVIDWLRKLVRILVETSRPIGWRPY